jgi:hypothetical protein
MSLRVRCPRCGTYWTARKGDSDVQCNCHLYCNEGNKPSDCVVTWVEYNGSFNWPVGVHLNFADDMDNQTNVNYYCATHGNYYFKAPVLIEVDWSKVNSRAKTSERYWGGGV